MKELALAEALTQNSAAATHRTSKDALFFLMATPFVYAQADYG